MIPSLEPPTYHVASLDVSVSPEVGRVVQGHVQVDIEMHSPDLSVEPEGFVCRSDMSLDLHHGAYPWHGNDGPSTFGEVAVETVVFVPGTRSDLRTYHDRWADGEYTDMDDAFVDHLESGILSHVMNPIASVLDGTFEGVVPRIRFTREPRPDETDE